MDVEITEQDDRGVQLTFGVGVLMTLRESEDGYVRGSLLLKNGEGYTLVEFHAAADVDTWTLHISTETEASLELEP